MSHSVIIVKPPPGLVASPTTVTVNWTPSHDLTPQQQQHRIDRAETMAQRIVNMLERGDEE